MKIAKIIAIVFLLLTMQVKAQSTNSTLRESSWSIPLHAGSYTFTVNCVNCKAIKKSIRIVSVYMKSKTDSTYTISFLTTKYNYRNLDQTPISRYVNNSFYHVQLTIDKEGNIIDIDEEKYAKMLKLWEEGKVKIRKRYKGEGVESTIKTVDDVLNNKEKLKKFLNNPKMFGIFLEGIAMYQRDASGEKNRASITKLKENTTQTNAIYNYNEDGIITEIYAKEKKKNLRYKERFEYEIILNQLEKY